MNEDPLKTLLHPFETGLVEPPQKGARVLVLNAPAGFRLPGGFDARVLVVQDFRPAFLSLVRDGHEARPEGEGDDFDVALVLAGRHRGRNELWIAEALRRVRPGGRIVVAGGKTDGAASLRKRMAALIGIDGHASKHHGVAFWFARASRADEAVSLLETANPERVLEGGFVTAPGLFSQDGVDPGSALLAANLPDAIGGAVADFGAGWGYLSVELARRASSLDRLDLFEASHLACDAARRNLAALAPGAPAAVHWHDLLSEPVERRYGLVVMNPPFHQGRAAEPSIGEGMIRAAAAALKPGGRLLMVANRQLPYEKTLQHFARSGESAGDGRFKVLWAVR